MKEERRALEDKGNGCGNKIIDATTEVEDGKKADGMKGQVRPDGQTYNSKIKFAQQKRGQNGNKISFITAG